MVDDVVLNKAATIERCVGRIRVEFQALEGSLRQDVLRQDSIVLNLQRACEASIDLAMHIVRIRTLGIPQESRDAFGLLETDGGLEADLADRMKKMVGFRNVAVHDYRSLDLDIVRSIIVQNLGDFLEFSGWAVTRFGA